MKRLLLGLLLVAACGQEDFDPTPFGSITDYQTWRSPIVFSGPVPGHGDGARPVFVNEVTSAYSHGGRYKPGSILVKEVRSGLEEDSSLDYLAIMRKVSDDEDAEKPPVPVDGGWIFSWTSGDAGGDETYWDLCWAQCHRQAPVDGAWLDYGL